jgi:amidase
MEVSAQQLRCLVPDSFALAGAAGGPLAGATFVAKDLLAVRGHTSSFGHPRWRETHAESEFTAPALERLRSAGASMLGLTKLDQLAYSLIGNVGEGEAPLNPLYPDRFTGGSSSGTASAVAGGLCDFGLGSDTAGSIRVPAGACGLYALRPSHGLLDATGALPLAPSFDVLGLLAREPRALRAALAALAPTEPPPAQPLRRVLVPDDCLQALDAEMAEVILAVASLLEDRCGVEIRGVGFAALAADSAAELFTRLQAREIWAAHSAWILANRSHLAPDVQTRLERAALLSAATPAERDADARARAQYTAAQQSLLDEGSAILLPAMGGLAPRREASAEELGRFRSATLRWTAPASLSGSPQAVLPVRHGGSGVTHGVGLLGAAGQDMALLDALGSAFGEEPLPTLRRPAGRPRS